MSAPLDSQEFAHEPAHDDCEREAEELRRYWEYLVGELRVVDQRLEELSGLRY